MKYELTHDTIARQVFEKASTEARTRRKVEKYIRDRFEAWQARGAGLDQDDIDYISPYLGQVNISEEEADFVENGRQELIRKKRIRRALVVGIIAILLAFSAVSFALWQRSNAALEATKIAREAAAVDRNKALLAEKAALDSAAIAQEQRLRALVALTQADSAREEAILSSVRARQSEALALSQKSLAEMRTLQAQALAITAPAISFPPRETPTALRILQAAYRKTLPARPPASVQRALAAKIYDQFPAPGQPARPLYRATFQHPAKVLEARFTPDGQHVFTSADDNTLRIWSLDGQVEQAFGHYCELGSFDFSRSGNAFLEIRRQNDTARIRGMDGRVQARLKYDRLLRGGMFSPDGQRIVTTSHLGKAALWDADGALLRSFDHDRVVLARYASDGKAIITSGGEKEKQVNIWSPNGELMGAFRSHIRSVNFVAGGQRVLTIGNYHKARILTLRDLQGNVVDTFLHDAEVVTPAFSPDGTQMITSRYADNIGEVWKIRKDKIELVRILDREQTLVNPLFSGDGKWILGTTRQGAANIWQPDGKRIAYLDQEGVEITGIAISADKKGSSPRLPTIPSSSGPCKGNWSPAWTGIPQM